MAGGGRGGGSLSTADPGAGAGCNCRSWCEEGPRAGAEALGKTISWNRPPREDRAPAGVLHGESSKPAGVVDARWVWRDA